MSISLKPKHVRRYRDVTRLLLKYGRADLVKAGGLEPYADEDDPVDRESAATGAGGNGAPGRVQAKAEELTDDLEALGPTFVKVGQFLSTRSDMLPPAYLQALSRLQDQIEPFPYAEVEKIVGEELGVRISKGFASFDEKPIAAASLGQVHHATLRGGRAVAVKVQRPDIQEQILEDLEAMAEIAGFLDRHTDTGRRFGFESIVEEFRKSLMRELDYRQEARHLSVLGRNLSRFEYIVVPSPMEDYVTSRVLTMEFIHGKKVTSLGPLARMELDGAPLAEALSQAYLHQVLVDGFFHADPHPGNIFLTDDGRVALLDAGMVAQVAPSMQESLLKLLLAVSEGQGEDAARMAISIGEELPGFDRATVERGIVELVSRGQGLRLEDMQLGRLVFELSRIGRDGGMRMPQELTMLGKTLLNIDHVGRALDPTFDPNASIRRNASEIMRERMKKALSPGKLFAGVLEAKDFAEKLPGRLNRLIDNVTENRLRVQVDAIDEVLLMEGLQKIANRITIGLIVSAMIVGAALLMRIETSFRLLGYPGLAILFFLAAAVTGLGLVVNILFSDIRGGKEDLAMKRPK